MKPDIDSFKFEVAKNVSGIKYLQKDMISWLVGYSLRTMNYDMTNWNVDWADEFLEITNDVCKIIFNIKTTINL